MMIETLNLWFKSRTEMYLIKLKPTELLIFDDESLVL